MKRGQKLPSSDKLSCDRCFSIHNSSVNQVIQCQTTNVCLPHRNTRVESTCYYCFNMVI
ncbi:hypothetical protein Hanom_Chr08g00695121 [Helianthus anomalus]